MKIFCLIVLIASLAIVADTRHDNYFSGKSNTFSRQQPQQKKFGGSSLNSLYSSKSNLAGGSNVQILRNDQQMQKDGSYHYEYETENGISGKEQGTGGVAVQGLSTYVSPEGVPIKLTYTADETGYHPVGDHIPQIPDYILRSLEYIRTHPFPVKKSYQITKNKPADIRAIPSISREISPPPRTPSQPQNTRPNARVAAYYKGGTYVKVQPSQYQRNRLPVKRRF